MTKKATLSVRIEPQLKAEAEAILREIGLKPSLAISMLYRQIVALGYFPPELKIPNEETVAALQEVIDGKTKKYASVDELLADLDS